MINCYIVYIYYIILLIARCNYTPFSTSFWESKVFIYPWSSNDLLNHQLLWIINLFCIICNIWVIVEYYSCPWLGFCIVSRTELNSLAFFAIVHVVPTVTSKLFRATSLLSTSLAMTSSGSIYNISSFVTFISLTFLVLSRLRHVMIRSAVLKCVYYFGVSSTWQCEIIQETEQ